MQIVFIGLVFAVSVFVLALLKNVYGERAFKNGAYVLIAWLSALSILAKNGFFAEFDSLPPHLALALIPNMAFLIFLGTQKKAAQTLIKVSVVPLIAFQSFRVVMEYVLYRLVEVHALPSVLTLSGGNYDIFVGTTAPIMAVMAYVSGKKSYGVLKVWNVLGFLILTNTLAHGILSAPTRLQVFFTDPSSALIATYPWIWLPGFVVPVALAGHILSFRQIAKLSQT